MLLYDLNASCNLPDFTSYLNEIKYHVEQLLNTHQAIINWPQAYTELARSRLSYGIQPYWLMHYSNNNQYYDFCLNLAHMLMAHEPRLHDVQVSVADTAISSDLMLHLHIRAGIIFDKKRSDIVMESSLSSLTKRVTIL